MALTDTFIRQVKHSAAAAGDKHTDGQGLYLLVKKSGKYWRMNFRFGGKQKTLALGVYPVTSLAKARTRRGEARELLADGFDPGQAKRDNKLTNALAAAHTFEAVARDWLKKLRQTVRPPLSKNLLHGWKRMCFHRLVAGPFRPLGRAMY